MHMSDQGLTDQDKNEEDEIQHRLLALLNAEERNPAVPVEKAKTRTLPILPEDIKRAVEKTGLVDQSPNEGGSTIVLRPEKRREVPEGDHAYGYVPGAAHEYVRLPRNPAAQRSNLPLWRIELHELGSSSQPPLGIELAGDVVIGLDRQDGSAPDLNLMDYSGLMHGISRRHALLRPTQNRLYLVDLDSTNGTMHNALPIIAGHAPELRHGDIITLGSLSFTLRIVRGPDK
jgi:hypothetical protein